MKDKILLKSYIILSLILGLPGCTSKWILDNYGGKQDVISGDPDKIYTDGYSIYLGINEYLDNKKIKEGFVMFPIRALYPQDIGLGRRGVRKIGNVTEGSLPSGLIHINQGKPSWNGQGYKGPAYYLVCTNSFDVILLQPSVPEGCNGPNNIANQKKSVVREWYRYIDTGLLLLISMPIDAAGLLLLGVLARGGG